MALQPQKSGFDLQRNIIKDFKENPLTTLQRAQLGAILNFSDQGIICFDTDQNLPYWWTGLIWFTPSGGSSVTAVVRWGNTIPSNTLGIDGDGYFLIKAGDVLNGTFYTRSSGIYTAQTQFSTGS